MFVEVAAFGVHALTVRSCRPLPLRRVARMAACDLAALVEGETQLDGSCPTWEALVAQGVLRRVPRDPWNTPFLLECEASVKVTSAGPDKTPGTEDDLNSWQR
jgi:hypothetical protein